MSAVKLAIFGTSIFKPTYFLEKETLSFSNTRSIRRARSSRSTPSSMTTKSFVWAGGYLTPHCLTRTKHPIILGSHPLALFIVRHIHVQALHSGTQLTLATLRRDIWLLRARGIVKSVIHRCVECTRYKSASPNQLMENLPFVRVSAPKQVVQNTSSPDDCRLLPDSCSCCLSRTR